MIPHIARVDIETSFVSAQDVPGLEFGCEGLRAGSGGSKGCMGIRNSGEASSGREKVARHDESSVLKELKSLDMYFELRAPEIVGHSLRNENNLSHPDFCNEAHELRSLIIQ